jgi:hypothetical protein
LLDEREESSEVDVLPAHDDRRHENPAAMRDCDQSSRVDRRARHGSSRTYQIKDPFDEAFTNPDSEPRCEVTGLIDLGGVMPKFKMLAVRLAPLVAIVLAAGAGGKFKF